MYIYAFTSFAPLNSYFSIERGQFGGNLFECFITLGLMRLVSSSSAYCVTELRSDE